MDEKTYQLLKHHAQSILELVRAFPAHEVMTYSDLHHPEDRTLTHGMWSLHCEAEI